MHKLQIDLYSHGFKVSRFDWTAQSTVSSFVGNYVKYGLVKVRGRFRKEMVKVYATATVNRSEYWFHANAYQNFLLHCDHNGISPYHIKIVTHRTPKAARAVFDVKEKWKPRDYQEPVIDYLESPHPTRVVTLQTGKGKAIRLDDLIKVPGGWKRMGDIKVGDIITAVDGGTTKVTAVYPQGKTEVADVIFDDGRKVRACPKHLWSVFHPNWVPRRFQGPNTMGGQTELGWRVITTEELYVLMQKPWFQKRAGIRLADSEQIADVELPLNPWVLGALLGDGHLGQSIYWTSIYPGMEESMVSKLNETMLLRKDQTNEEGGKYRIIRNPKTPDASHIKDILRNLDLLGKRAWEKHIPTEYLHASHQQRLELLQGLMDTDGSVGKPSPGRNGKGGKCGKIDYSTTSEQLAKDVQYLVRSLGGIASITERQTYYTHNGEKKAGRPSYRVNIRMRNPKSCVTVPHKSERLTEDNQYSATLRLGIKEIVSLQDKEETQCISVDHPSKLFITNDFIVTHNTFCALYAIASIGERTACVVAGRYAIKWKEDVEKTYNLKKGQLMIVRGSKHLKTLIQLAKDGDLEADFIIITSKTMYNFYKDYEQSGGRSSYGCKPQDFYKVISAGVRLIDEVHEDFHLNFKQDLYTNINKTLSLSATLESKDAFMNRMYDLMFPKNIWYTDGYDRYIDVTSLHYQLEDPNKVRHLAKGRGSYSHTEFENSLMKQPERLKRYLDMITNIIIVKHIEVAEEKQCMMVFAATVDLCTVIVDHLGKALQEKTVTRYVSEDDYEVLFKHDIIVSTLLSAGTAVDIPGLRHVLMTTAIDSVQKNAQALGRLRDLEKQGWKGQHPEFMYLVCDNIPKQVEYHRNKLEDFSNKCKSHSSLTTGVTV